MKKKIVMCSLLLGTILMAEDSGLFAGVSYQIGKSHLDEKGSTAMQQGGMVVEQHHNVIDELTNGAGIQLGYKQFFGASKALGLRYYGFLDYGYTNFGSKILHNGEDYYTHMLGYGVGADVLWDFINKESQDFGVFAGVGIGGETWIANGKEIQEQNLPKGKASYVNFQTTIDVGLRSNLYKHHGFEIGMKIPLLEQTIFEDKDDNSKIVVSTSDRTIVKHKYSFYVSYLYTF
ncbi:outer membrane protein [Helicobacter sp. 11S02596-1]|uniref:outer membrane protein n=1 Tax=Helicobacter sp. 11S02596-1 TaxID=1476194 RepID=UPI000BC68C4E|nr:outer membrane protein [Helicobacter sp. 11S02596-1]PAF44473.1 hypothetical protein BJI48_02820 [Helicobacter sp. 11S02596-1]